MMSDATLQRGSQLPSAKVAALLAARCIFLPLTKRLHEKVTSASASIPFYGGAEIWSGGADQLSAEKTRLLHRLLLETE